MKNVSRAANAIFQFENPEKPVQPNTLCIRPVRWSLLFNDNPSIHQSNITLLQPLFLTAKGHNSHSCWRSLSVKCKFRLFWGIWTTESAVFLGRDILVLRLLSVGVFEYPLPLVVHCGSETHIFSMVIWAVLFSPGLAREAKSSRVWGNGFTPSRCGCALTVI